jgi:ATP phosphoribosyltransferase regulatory subunit
LGQLQFFHALLQELQLTSEQTVQLQRAINRNSGADLTDFLRNTPLRTQQRHTVEQLPLLSGPKAQSVIAQADRLCLNYAMHKALANLRDIYQVLDAHGVTDEVYLDLTEINNLGYYTGISFEVLIPGLGFPIGGGGRYDNLIGTFGAAQPAVGVALGLDRILLAQRAAGIADDETSATPHILVAAANNADALTIVSEWRRKGLRVVVSIEEQGGEELWLAAQKSGIALAARWTGQGFDLYGLHPDKPASATFIPQVEAHSIIEHAKRSAPASSKMNNVIHEGRIAIGVKSSKGLTPEDTRSDIRSEEKYGLRS